MMATLTQRSVLFCALAAALCVALLFVENTAAREGSAAKAGPAARQKTASRSQTRRASSDKSNVRRLREGTIVSGQSGFFREDGEGATFVTDDGLEFGALPNLNLERVVRLLKSAEESSSIRWSVTGKVTEFSGRNFLLMSRATYKSATPPPVPEHVAP